MCTANTFVDMSVLKLSLLKMISAPSVSNLAHVGHAAHRESKTLGPMRVSSFLSGSLIEFSASERLVPRSTSCEKGRFRSSSIRFFFAWPSASFTTFVTCILMALSSLACVPGSSLPKSGTNSSFTREIALPIASACFDGKVTP